MTDYDLHTEETHNPTEHFWKRLKVGDTVLGRAVVREGKDTTCGWPQLDDLMSDEGRSWMVCRAGFDHPACGCPDYDSDMDDDYTSEERALWNDAQVKHIMHFVDLATAEIKRLRKEKEAMLKHITDLEASLTELNNDWLAGNDMDEAFTEHFKKFSYLRAQSKAVHDAQQDDGYEPPEHMTADDFNEMHSGPYQPDDSGYMDGDY